MSYLFSYFLLPVPTKDSIQSNIDPQTRIYPRIVENRKRSNLLKNVNNEVLGPLGKYKLRRHR